MKRQTHAQSLIYVVVVLTVVAALVFGAARLLRQPALPARSIRNVLLISIDTCRADHLSCYGDQHPTTPNIDAIARQGILFENAISPLPMTLPAHSSMHTGTIPPYHGVRDNFEYRLGPSNVTLAEMLKGSGLNTAAFISAYPLDGQFGLDQGFDTYNDRFEDPLETMRPERRGGETSRLAIDWLQHHRDEPFFLFLHYFDPHIAYIPPPPFDSKFADDPYRGEIAYTDHCIGEVIAELNELDIYDSTLIVITADHGEMRGEHGESTHGFFVYQSAIKVPLIFKVPGATKEKRIPALVGLIDIVPTICNLLDITPPREVQGVSLAPWLDESSRSRENGRELYSESLLATKYEANALSALVTPRWKYIQANSPELYNLVDDPGELENLVESEPRIAADLQDRLEQLLQAQSGDKVADSALAMSDETIKQLTALGYTGGSVTDDMTIDPSRPDPKDLIEFHELDNRLVGLFEHGQYAAALPLCKEMVVQRPDFWGTQYSLGTAYLRLGREDEAIPCLRRTLELKPDAPSANTKLGSALIRQGQLDEAADSLRKAVASNPRDAQAHHLLAMIFRQTGRLKLAVTHFYKSIDLDPDSVVKLNNLAWLLATCVDENIRRPQEAIELAERTAGLTSRKSAAALDTLAAAYAAVGRFEDAVRASEEALALMTEPKMKAAAIEVRERLERYNKSEAYLAEE